jgi:hypothetical protein
MGEAAAASNRDYNDSTRTCRDPRQNRERVIEGLMSSAKRRLLLVLIRAGQEFTTGEQDRRYLLSIEILARDLL